MYIKEVNIVDFRSYRDQNTIDSFSSRHNVIVGRNGSGKSNFFLAIQFVLSDEFGHLRAEQRMSMLHEGTGPRITNARVEIVFDNSDRRIPAIDALEVRITRQVGNKKDQYFIDGKVVPRAEVVNLMESAGFSRSNPYYIVKQGKINELATAPDAHRLKLLREVAGTRVYDERKDESMKVLKETQFRTKKVEELLKYIDERLKTLEEEKEDLKEYQKWDKMKRSVEYTMNETDLQESRKKLEKLTDQREELNQRQNKVSTELMEVQARGLRASTEQRRLDSRFKGMREEKEALVAEQSERYEKKTELELLIKDLTEDVDKERTGRSKAETDLNTLLSEIKDKEREIESITPRYQELIESEAALTSDIRIAEMRSKELFSKQGHREQFKSAEERDEFLKREVRQINRQIADVEEQITDIESSIKEEQAEEEKLNGQIMEVGMQLHENHDKLEKLSNEHANLKSDCDKAVVLQLDSNRGEKVIRDQLASLQTEISQMEQTMRTIVARPTMHGVESVKKVVQWFRDNNQNGKYDHVVNGYYGILLDLFECNEAYFQAVEVTAGNRLFYHVVSDDSVATMILNQVNRLGLPGECNFYPINRLPRYQRRHLQENDARHILAVLEYRPEFETVFCSVFGKTAIVRNLEIGSRLAKGEGFDCVTMDGDQVSKRGALTGGYLDSKKNKLEVHHNVANLEDQKKQLQACLEEEQRKSAAMMNNVERIRIDIDRIENEMRLSKETHRTLTEKKRYLCEQLHSMGRLREPKNAQLITLRNRIRETVAQRDHCQSEIGTALLSQLTHHEQEECEHLQREMREKKHLLEEVARERSILEMTKKRIENQLTTNLLRKRDNLSAKVNDISVSEKRYCLSSESNELKSVTQRLQEIARRLSELDECLIEYEESAEKLARELEDVQEQQKDLEVQISDFSKQADIICTKQSALQTKKEDLLKKLRDIGSLPTEAFSKYLGMSSKQLDKKLEECLNELKKYENVNKKALDQFVQAAAQKEELTKRKDENAKSETSIKELLNVLETRKFEAINLTFKQVSKNFRDVFKKLVPDGEGKLVIQAAGQDQNAEQVHSVENYTGVGIKVSFNGTSETREMQQLSGGQKSLVALALIFSIQMCDPAPFYLFDEIDAALDAQHRKAVADMIHELSSNAQFITTTFRPELLEHAEKFYGVKFRNKVSHIDVVSKLQAHDFVEDDQTHG